MARTSARSSPADQERTVHRDTLLCEYGRLHGGANAAFQLAQDSIDALAGRYVGAWTVSPPTGWPRSASSRC
ncbi:hypothetical protein BJF83_24675 [Nocardiopsis sp. CNR-923]|uniref:hypothetical protein n=1 Tax=Nocardiopsis sp. CNR-923 TaxID=1904965 RepID=UPI0009620A8F|nr:hypothetical protein [Nocardiopsis sp. CNR-923]OLT30538.1 hypothetical protein BJF83_24675 [Nocardiopsis sp. CNR-923]